MSATIQDVRHSTRSTSDDPLAQAVTMIANAMQTDYSAQFHQFYKTDEDIRQLKRRLYSKLKGIDEQCIYAGYEICTQSRPNFLPTLPEIIAGALTAQKDAKRVAQNQAEVIALPLNPKRAPMPQNIREIWERIQAESGKESLEELTRKHEALIADHLATGKIKSRKPATQLCARCGRFGIMSHGVNGGSNWYCSDHFEMTA